MGIHENLEAVFNAELVKRLLIKYFSDKGFTENFDRKVYPPLLQDICECIPELTEKVEVVPHVIEISPNEFARLGWNLFVLGNQRMYLGESEHTNLSDLGRQIESKAIVIPITEDQMTVRRARTARDIVSWIAKTLGKSEGGLIRMTSSQPSQMYQNAVMPQSNALFERPKVVRPEGGSQH